jgi:hypothetical protein
MPSQAQKHVTHNEALRILDAIVQLAIIDRGLADPPPSPTEGDRYIVAAGATGAWEGKDNRIAAWQDDGWNFLDPKPGWLAFVLDEAALFSWTGSAPRRTVRIRSPPSSTMHYGRRSRPARAATATCATS